MKTFDFIQATISHHLKDPHSKALEPDYLPPLLLAIMTQSPEGVGRCGGALTLLSQDVYNDREHGTQMDTDEKR